MRIIADVGNPVYYRQRVCELLKTLDAEDCDKESGNAVMRQCISILALAIAESEINE
jgi:hypothetical protein